MIISAPEIGPMIAGFPLLNVNTRPSGSRWGATESGTEKTRATRGKSSESTRIKSHAAKGAPTPMTALTLPHPLLLSDNRRGVQAVLKPMARVYATRLRRAVTKAGRSVVISTVSVVDCA